ncbi:MAG: UDP-N-acetylmuramate dehydrogenase [Aurantibacter sp.]
MEIRENVSLQEYNTFGINARARYLVIIDKETDLPEILRGNNDSLLVLGGGSNVLFDGDFKGMVVRNNILGREIIKEDDDFVWVQLGAGENWHQVVLWAINHGWGGIENLSLIPGTVGAAPMQNIGAYGVEISSVFSSLEAIDRDNGKARVFNITDCEFGYRNSAFKGELKDRYIITRVVLRFHKHPIFNTSYGAVSKTLEEMGVTELNLKDVSNAVISIRQSKLPDPEKIGNAGSFFKNPAVEESTYHNLKTVYTNIPSYPTEENLIKIPAGWLIEQCNWKGFRKGDIGVHEKQALVLVNYGAGNGNELVELSREIQASVDAKFGIKLIPEVNIV